MSRRRLLENGVNANGYDFVDMGAAGIWAACNVGANKPEEYGLYFAWGEITGYKDQFSGKGFYWNDYKWSNGSTRETLTKYCNSSSHGKVDNKSILDLEDDAAHIIMGGNWRIPTIEEFSTLWDTCNIIWTSRNGINGALFSLKTDSSKTLFFPASGRLSQMVKSEEGSRGLYWSSSLHPNFSYMAQCLLLRSGLENSINYNDRYTGYSVRGILDI
ncbi:MAG: hypothetical protein J1F67_05200 [Muribaculaceae bacterium]|nr:hypothetical protein [Muribaculaceae bacterium]